MKVPICKEQHQAEHLYAAHVFERMALRSVCGLQSLFNAHGHKACTCTPVLGSTYIAPNTGRTSPNIFFDLLLPLI